MSESTSDLYAVGFADGLDWLDTAPGRAFMADADVPVPQTRHAQRDAGFADALKDTGWHRRHPGELCHRGADCWALARLRPR